MAVSAAIKTHQLIVNGLPVEGLLPTPMSMETFIGFCAQNPELRIERDSEGNVIVMPPVHTESGFFEGEVFFHLRLWNQDKGKPGIAFSSSAGFTLPNGAVRSPDASWLSNEKWAALSKAERKSFAPVVPEFVVEIRSATDKEPSLYAKMEEWIENGALLGWLIDPILEQARVYRADGSISVIKSFDEVLSGEQMLPGFSFGLQSLKSE